MPNVTINNSQFYHKIFRVIFMIRVVNIVVEFRNILETVQKEMASRYNFFRE